MCPHRIPLWYKPSRYYDRLAFLSCGSLSWKGKCSVNDEHHLHAQRAEVADISPLFAN